jgi:2-polyprenyl-6-methoxyphenol hydroxylase-like FAD-dependent oxidoreductase
VRYTLVEIPRPEENALELKKLVNSGTLMVVNNGKFLGIQQLGSGSLSINYSAARQEDWAELCGRDTQNLAQAKEIILEEVKTYDTMLRSAIESACENLVSQNMYMLPVGWRWTHAPGVTIIRDAAHLMTNFAGEGVNMALDDPRRLAAAIVRSAQLGRSLDLEVQTFEEEMFVRMEKIQRVTHNMTQLFFSTDGDMRSIIPHILEQITEDGSS